MGDIIYLATMFGIPLIKNLQDATIDEVEELVLKIVNKARNSGSDKLDEVVTRLNSIGSFIKSPNLGKAIRSVQADLRNKAKSLRNDINELDYRSMAAQNDIDRIRDSSILTRTAKAQNYLENINKGENKNVQEIQKIAEKFEKKV